MSSLVLFWIGRIVTLVASIYLLVLLVRMVYDWIQVLSPQWRPTGIVMMIGNLVYALTDPPLKFLRRFIPPLRLGGIALDVGFLVVFVCVIAAQRLGQFLIMIA